MDIVFQVNRYYPFSGGSESVVRSISEYLVKRGHRVRVVTSVCPERKDLNINGVEIVEFNLSGCSSYRPIGTKGEEERYKEFLLNLKADIIIFYAAQQWGVDIALPILNHLKIKKVFMPCGFAGLVHPGQKKVFELYYKKMKETIKGFDIVIPHSSLNADYKFCVQHGIKNLEIIPNGAYPLEFSKKQCSFKKKYGIKFDKMLLYVGNFFGGKGHTRLSLLMKRLKNNIDAEDVNAGLVMIADKKEMLYDRIFDINKNVKNVKILTGIPREDVLAAFIEADIFLCASEYETAPLVILESMMAGTPWVSTSVGNVGELEGGFVCRDRDILGDMERYTVKILKDEKLKKNLSIKGKKAAMSVFNWDLILKKYEDTFNEVIYGKKQGGNEMKKVSVILPVKNGYPEIGPTIESVLTQSYNNLELIVINDGSTDRTAECLENYLKAYPDRIKVLTNKENLGITKSLNRGIEESSGDFIARIDSGDFYLPGKIEKQVRIMEILPDVGMVTTGGDPIDGKRVKRKNSYFDSENLNYNNKEDLFLLFLANNRVIHGSVLIRRDVFNKVGLYRNSRFKHVEDYDLWLRIIRAGIKMFHIDTIFYQWKMEEIEKISREKCDMQMKNVHHVRGNNLREIAGDRKLIVYLVDVIAMGGAEKFCYELAKNIDKEKYYPVICAMKKSGPSGEMFEKMLWESGIPIVYGIYDPRHNDGLSQMETLLGYADIIHTNYWGNDWIEGKLQQIKEFNNLNHSFPEIIRTVHSQMEYIKEFSFKTVDISVRKKGQKEIKNKEVLWVANGVDSNKPSEEMDVIAEKHGIDIDKDFIIGTVGHIDENKNYMEIVYALADIKREEPSLLDRIKVLIVGPTCEWAMNYNEMLREAIRKNGLEKNFVFTGNSENPQNEIQLFNLAIHPSKKEGFCLALLEYMKAGVQIVVRDSIDSDVIDFNPLSTEKYGKNKKLKDIITYWVKRRETDDRSMIDAMRDQYQKETVDFFSLDKMVKNYEKVYEGKYNGME